MPNKLYAKEWLSFAYKNLATAKLLLDANHFEDIIGVEIQQAMEKTLKALLAYQNKKIPREHDLIKLYFLVDDLIEFDENSLLDIRIASNYYKEERYPNPNYSLPSKEEIARILLLAKKLFEQASQIVQIDSGELFNQKQNPS